MSGGSYSYIYSRLEGECEGRMYDVEMDDLIKDLCNVLHDLEWWQSGDTSEEEYRNTLTAFKKKWFKGDRQERLKGYIDEQIGMVRSQLYSLIGEPQESVSSTSGWIPTAERLPENRNQEVLISLEWGIDIGRYSDGEWHSEWINHYDDGNVTAWMPLPKPYREENKTE